MEVELEEEEEAVDDGEEVDAAIFSERGLRDRQRRIAQSKGDL